MRRVAVGLGLALATVGVGGTVASAGAVPPGLLEKGVLEFACDDGSTLNVVAGNGRAGVDADTGDRVLVVEFAVLAADGSVLDSKTYPGEVESVCRRSVTDETGAPLTLVIGGMRV